MNPWVLAGTAFVACAVEAVEAATIVLAVAVTNGLRTALAGTVAALAVLSLMTAIGAPLLANASSLGWLELIAGPFLIYFGFTWLRKAVLRYAGRKELHDEDAIYMREVARLKEMHESRAAFAAAFQGIFVEGLEVVIIVVTFAASAPSLIGWTVAGAIAAVVTVTVAAILIHAPLARVPENTLKAVVGVMLVALGTFWTGEGLHVRWWFGDVTLVVFALGYTAITVVTVAVLRSSNQPRMS